MNLKMRLLERKPEAKIFRHLRIAAGLTQRQLATLLGCDHSYIAHYENGRENLSEERTKQLCAVFKITEERLNEYVNGAPVPMNYRDECYLIVSKLDENQLRAVYGMLVSILQ